MNMPRPWHGDEPILLLILEATREAGGTRSSTNTWFTGTSITAMART
jgi:hypothetical protein